MHGCVQKHHRGVATQPPPWGRKAADGCLRQCGGASGSRHLILLVGHEGVGEGGRGAVPAVRLPLSLAAAALLVLFSSCASRCIATALGVHPLRSRVSPRYSWAFIHWPLPLLGPHLLSSALVFSWLCVCDSLCCVPTPLPSLPVYPEGRLALSSRVFRAP